MDEATLARAIEPFFSTKGIGKGTGLGLSMVHGLALQLDGGLTITSRLGEGTVVDLWFPISSVMADEQADPLVTSRVGRAWGWRCWSTTKNWSDRVRPTCSTDLGYEVVEALLRRGGAAVDR